MEKNKLIEEIEKLIKPQNSFEITENVLAAKLFTLISDVAVKFAEWHDTALLTKEAVNWLKENNLEFGIQSTFLYFIEHIYPALYKNLNK